MFLSRNKKKIYFCKPQFHYIKKGLRGSNYIGVFSWYVFKIRLCSISSGFQNSEIPLVSFQTMAMFHTYSFQNSQITNCLLSAFEIQLCSVSSHLKHSVAYCFKLRLFQQYLFEISYNLFKHTYIQTVRFMKKM